MLQALPNWAHALPPALLGDYRAALERIYALGQGRMLPGRERLRELLARCGDPQLAVPAILIGGTNGKGRLATALSAALSRRYRTGAFIKPHLKSIRERWRLNDQPVGVAPFVAAAEAGLAALDSYTSDTGQPISYFEANVLLGALLFRDSGCEIAVWEVGLGGRQDACNLVEPLLSAITNVQHDHQAILGDTLELIALDKAGIARPGRPLLLGPPRAGWEADYSRYAPVIAAEAARSGASMIEVPAALSAAAATCAAAGLPADSSALLAALLEQLGALGFPLEPGDLQSGLAAMHYRGRMERTRLAGRPVLLDAAHNPDSLRWLGLKLRELAAATPDAPAGFPIVFGCQTGRDPRAMLSEIAAACASVTPVCIPVLHPAPVEAIAAAARSLGLRVELPPDAAAAPDAPADLPLGHNTELDPPDFRGGWIEAADHALSLATVPRPAVVCGSIYCIGEILRAYEDGWLPR